MVGTPQPISTRHVSAASLPFAQEAGQASFTWSLAKLRIASLVLLAAAMPAAVLFAISPPFLKWLCLAWLAGVGFFMHGISRRACSDAVVLSVDQRGILDRRLMSRRIAWQEIAAICPVDMSRGHVVDIALHWPKITLGQARWPVRIGAHCQTGYGVPALTISMLLLEGSVSEVRDAVACYRPDLLHHTNRRASLDGSP